MSPTVLKLRQDASKSGPRRTAQVFVQPQPNGRRRSGEYAPLVVRVGRLLELRDEGHVVLGMAAAIAGVRTYTAFGPGVPESGVRIQSRDLIISRGLNEWHSLRLPPSVEYAVHRFQTGLHSALYTSCLFLPERAEERERALALVPAELRVQSVMTPKVYRDDGSIKPSREIAYEAREQAMFRALEEGRYLPGCIPLELDFKDVTRLTQDDEGLRGSDPVVLGSKASQQIKRTLDACGIRHTPRTMEELVGLHRFAVHLAVDVGLFTDNPSAKQLEFNVRWVNEKWDNGAALMLAIAQGRLEDAASWHAEHKTVEILAPATYRFIENMPVADVASNLDCKSKLKLGIVGANPSQPGHCKEEILRYTQAVWWLRQEE